MPLPAALPPTTVADVLALVWPPGLPTGRYVFFVVLVAAGGASDGSLQGDLLALALRPIDAD